MVVAWAPEGGCTVAVTLDISLDRIWEADLVANGVAVVARLSAVVVGGVMVASAA